MIQNNSRCFRGKTVKVSLLVLAACAIIAIATWYTLQSSTTPQDDPTHRTLPPNAQDWRDLYNQLTPDQKTELMNEIIALRSQGASQEDISAAIKELLKCWGYELP